jgi:polar amino acid transport system permease protein
MERLIEQFFNVEIMAATWPMVLQGLGMTLLICLAVIPMGLAGGLLAALGSAAKSRWVRWPVIALVDFFRAIPPLVLLIFVYAGLPFAGVQLSPFMAVVIAFFLNNSAY